MATELTPRERAVLATMTNPHILCRAPWVARLLNPPLAPEPCDWCPVGPPRPREKCATVSRAVAARVRRVLLSLVRKGRAEWTYPNTRMNGFTLAPADA